MESTGSYAACLTRHLIAESVRVLEVNQPHADARRRRGKTDAIDAAKFALRSLARRITSLDEEIAGLDAQLAPLVATAAPRTVALLGISTGHAGQLLLTAGQNIERLHSESAFAALCGASPVPVASGKRGRYRLNPGGDRQANRALHMIAVCRLRYCPQTRADAERRTTEGKTEKEITRCRATSPARSTAPCATTSALSPSLDIYRNVPGRLTSPSPGRSAARPKGSDFDRRKGQFSPGADKHADNKRCVLCVHSSATLHQSSGITPRGRI